MSSVGLGFPEDPPPPNFHPRSSKASRSAEVSEDTTELLVEFQEPSVLRLLFMGQSRSEPAWPVPRLRTEPQLIPTEDDDDELDPSEAEVEAEVVVRVVKLDRPSDTVRSAEVTMAGATGSGRE